ncbi:TPA: hypothetical protein ENG04_13150 [Candidatus Poribacteria bacterium]|nr:hypothetical protein [Candidatus Poribacteria bacterium]HEX31021.1 hypothetical protein [Candidatus Poribacteria bacterium]
MRAKILILTILVTAISLIIASSVLSDLNLPNLRLVFTSVVDKRPLIYVMDGVTEKARPKVLVDKLAKSYDPRWSPDGRYIAFTGVDGGAERIYLVDMKTGRIRPLLDTHFGWEFNPRWSPDGSRIAFNIGRTGKGYNPDLYVFDLRRDKLTKVLENFSSYLLGWTPEGRKLCFQMRWADPSIYTVDAEVKNPIKLDVVRNVFDQLKQFDKLVTIPKSRWFWGISFSPDGTKVAVSAETFFKEEIYLVDLSLKKIEVLTGHLPGNKFEPRWSPDGKYIFFSISDRNWGRGISIVTPQGDPVGRLRLDDYICGSGFDLLDVRLAFPVAASAELKGMTWGEVKIQTMNRRGF